MRHALELGEPDLAVIGPRPLVDRVLARVFGASLDESLASGSAPESSRLLAARARDIVSLPRRTSMAGNWDHLLRVAHRSARAFPLPRPGAIAGAVPVCADRIVAAEPAVRELIARLSAPLPVPARGVAMASALLTDGMGPVFNRRSRVTLAAALDAAITQLDPALPLMPAAPPRP
jgi:hypothetical protein